MPILKDDPKNRPKSVKIFQPSIVSFCCVLYGHNTGAILNYFNEIDNNEKPRVIEESLKERCLRQISEYKERFSTIKL